MKKKLRLTFDQLEKEMELEGSILSSPMELSAITGGETPEGQTLEEVVVNGYYYNNNNNYWGTSWFSYSGGYYSGSYSSGSENSGIYSNGGAYGGESYNATYSSPIPMGKLIEMFNNVAKMDADKVYKLIGGSVLNNHISNPKDFSNACALRLSYALNMIKDFEIPYANGQTLSGDVNRDGVKEWYYFRMEDIKTYIDNISSGTFKKVSKNEIIGKKGIISFGDCNWSNATGHVDVWDGSKVLGDDHSNDCDEIYFLEIKS